MKEIQLRLKFIERKLSSLKRSIEFYEAQKEEHLKEIGLNSIERDCEEIIEFSIRVNQDLLRQKNFLADTYKESFELLPNVDENFKKLNLKKYYASASFRNKLAHDYLDLDTRITVSTAKKMISLYKEYLLVVNEVINKK